jgi:hypothetical protein
MSTELGDEQQDDAEKESARFAALPSDFPRPPNLSGVSGAQEKFSMNSYRGRFYSPGCSPPELLERWDNCEDIAQQLAVKSVESKNGKRSHMSEVEILDQYLPRLIATGWVSEPEAKWVMRRTAALVGWQIPPSASS